ncbi:MAG TPA: hypothetical protein VF317_04995, partial [Dermatophilaceae bacterium]
SLMADQLAEAGHQDQAASAWDESRTSIALPQLRAYISAAAAAWHDRRGDRVQAEARIHQAVSEALDPTGADQVADYGSSIPDYAPGESRRYARSVAVSMNPLPDGLPNWAVGQVHDLDVDLARAWAGATTLSAAAAVLRERSEVVSGQTLPETLDILLTLHPDDQRLTGLAALHEDVVQRGLSQVLADLAAQDELQTLIHDWINTDTWAASFTYLGEHVDQLCTDEVVQLLVAAQNPTAFQHAAILSLCETIAPQQIEELVTDASAAADLALDAVEAGILGRVHLLTVANPGTLQLPGTGPVLQAVLLLAAGDRDGAAAAARTATEVQRGAHTTRLEGLAKHAEVVDGGAASVSALIDVYTTVVLRT